MAIYFQHVGERGAERDFPKTIGGIDGLRLFTLFDLPDLNAELGTEDLASAQAILEHAAPDGFQIWGIPSGAASVIRNLKEGDWMLLLTSDRPGGTFHYAGRVVYRPNKELFGLSQLLWGEAKFPLILFLSGRLTSYSWSQFRTAFGYAENWRLAGNTYRLLPNRISQSIHQSEDVVIDAIVGVPGFATGHVESSLEVIAGAEAFSGSPEGRQLLKEHLLRERDPDLIRRFRRNLTSFRCEICGFDFGVAYGELGKGFIEVHHQAPLGMREGNEITQLGDLLAVCSNCHRMLHRRFPPLTARELTETFGAQWQSEAPSFRPRGF